MSLQQLTNNYVSFNAWANTQFVEWLQNIDKGLLYQPVKSSFTSIDYTLQHILRVQKFWLNFVCEKDVTKFDWSVHENQVERILVELKDQSDEMKNQIVGFTEEQLIQRLTLDMPWAKNELSRYEYILHAVNHSTFHRGQMVTMARSIGITENIPGTDYNFYHCR